jgi:hypothetical protein
MSREQIEGFDRAISRFLVDWKSMELRVVAERGRAGQWVLNSLRAILEHGEDGPLRRDLPTVEGLLVLDERWHVDRLSHLLDSLGEGEVKLGGETISLKRPNTSPPNPSFYVRRRDRSATLAEFGIDSSSLVLSSGDSLGDRLVRDEFRTIDDSLQAHSPPWDGLADLRRNFIGIPKDQSQRHDWSSAEIVAPIGVRLDQKTRLEQNQLEVVVSAFPHVALDDLSAAIVAQSPGGAISRLQIKFLRGANISETEVRNVARLPELPTLANVVLTYRGIRVDRKDLRGKGSRSIEPRLAVLEKIAGGSDALAEGLERARTRGREIEGWVALIFSHLKFISCHYGSTPWEAPDIVAMADSEDWMFVVECTEREPDLGGKVTKLATRTKEIEHASGVRAFPVLVTALDRSVLNATDLEKASKEAIAILSSTEFSDLIRLVGESATATETRSFFERLIPQQEYQSVYWRT